MKSRHEVIESYKKSNSISIVASQAVQLIDKIQDKYKEETKHEQGKMKYKRSLEEDRQQKRRVKNKTELRTNLVELRKRIYGDERASRLLEKV